MSQETGCKAQLDKDLVFKKFPKITRFSTLYMSITQKIHGTNASIHIFKNEAGELDLRCGSRTRWIFPGDDNYGFAGFVHAHKAEFIEKLGEGTHYGEYAGVGINSGEGLTEKTFVLFDAFRYGDDLPPNTVKVPVLYTGAFSIAKIDEVMADLKENGSRLVPGFMRPEGIVIQLGGVRYKKVFDAEETQWRKSGKTKAPKVPGVDYSYLCQPIRLEKLLSRDERYLREYPRTLPQIVKDYVADLVEENQIAGDADQIKAVKKGASKQIFAFVRHQIENQN